MLMQLEETNMQKTDFLRVLTPVVAVTAWRHKRKRNMRMSGIRPRPGWVKGAPLILKNSCLGYKGKRAMWLNWCFFCKVFRRVLGTEDVLNKYWHYYCRYCCCYWSTIVSLLQRENWVEVQCNVSCLSCCGFKRGRGNQLDITHIYRTFYPTVTEYTFFSRIHGVFSRIEHFLGNKTSLNKF
jgi:hypothetical protein